MNPQSRSSFLKGRSSEILRVVSKSATDEQWAEWLQVPLEHAAADGNLDLFNALLEAGTKTRAGWRGCDGRTLLQAAVCGRSVDIVSSLLMTGAQQDVNVVCYRGRSPLFWAVMLGDEAIARRLVLAGADVNFADPEEKCTVLHQAVEGGYGELVNDLLLAGADTGTPKEGFEIGATALHVAATAGLADIVSALLLRGAAKDQFDQQGNTPLTYATRAGHVPVVEALLAAGADFHTTVTFTDVAALSVLDLAAELGHDAVLKAFIRNRARVDGGVAGCMASLAWAVFGDQPRTINALVEAGADVEMLMNNSMTPLLYAAAGCHYRAMHALLRHGASVSARSPTGQTVLHLICSRQLRGCEEVVDLLLRMGADETALDGDLCIPVTRLGLPSHAHGGPECILGEVAHIRTMLLQAPADRAWRRRGWLAILRSRTDNARYSELADGGNGIGSSVLGDMEAPRTERSGRAEKGGEDEKDAKERHEIQMSREGVAGVVDMLTGRASKDVFRTAVGFL